MTYTTATGLDFFHFTSPRRGTKLVLRSRGYQPKIRGDQVDAFTISDNGNGTFTVSDLRSEYEPKFYTVTGDLADALAYVDHIR